MVEKDEMSGRVPTTLADPGSFDQPGTVLMRLRVKASIHQVDS